MQAEESKFQRRAPDGVVTMQKKLVAEFANDSYVKMNGSLKLGKDVSQT
jgi:hypothetical protein